MKRIGKIAANCLPGADALGLFSLGIQLAFVLGVLTYRLHARGWPGWVPDWFPGPSAFLTSILPPLAILSGGLALLVSSYGNGAVITLFLSRAAAMGAILLFAFSLWMGFESLFHCAILCLAAAPLFFSLGHHVWRRHRARSRK